MNIEVTAEDIAYGKRRDPKCCALGRALDRAGVIHFGVMGTAVLLADEFNLASAHLLPPSVQRWVLDFDEGKPVKPFSFELPVMEALAA